MCEHESLIGKSGLQKCLCGAYIFCKEVKIIACSNSTYKTPYWATQLFPSNQFGWIEGAYLNSYKIP